MDSLFTKINSNPSLGSLDSQRAMKGFPSEPTVFEKMVWTVEDVARELGCSVRLVHKLVHADRIPYAKVGRLVRFSRLPIHEWLQTSNY